MERVKIDLGSGNDKKEGYLRIDKSPAVNPDYVIDLEQPDCLKKHFDDDSVHEIRAHYIMEHIQNLIPLMNELHRIIMRNYGVLKMTIPHYKCEGAFRDPTHVRFFTEKTMEYFSKDYVQNFSDYGILPWTIIKQDINKRSDYVTDIYVEMQPDKRGE